MRIKSSSRLNNFTTLLFTFFLFNSLQAQIAKTELRIDKDHLFDIRVKLEDNVYTISMDTNGTDFSNSIIVTSFTSSVLRSFIISTMEKEMQVPFSIGENLSRMVDTRFIELMTALYNTEQEGQIIATIRLAKECKLYTGEEESIQIKKTYPFYRLKKRRNLEKKEVSKRILVSIDSGFCVENAQIVFEDGFIKSVLIKGNNSEGTEYLFSNQYSIGATTRSNILNFNKIILTNELRYEDKFIKLADVLIYERNLGLRTNDYSPADQVVYITPNDKNGIILKKTPSPEIFTMNLFSDFVGVNQNNPNGLIQTEISKRVNLWTKRYRFPWKSGIGYLTHIAPVLEISKIEENNKYMPLINQSIDTANSNYANPLQVLRYSALNVRTEVNAIDIQTAAVTININALAGVAVTYVQDSIVKNNTPEYVDETINTFAYGSNIKFIFNPESKWSYTMTGTYLKVNNLNDKFMYRTIKNNALTNSSKNLWSGELLVAWNTSEDNKLFGRFRYNWEGNNVYNNYSEFQIGFSKKFKSSKAN